MELTLMIQEGKQKGRVISVKEFPAFFGRGQDCNYMLEESSISRKHFVIHHEGDVFYIEDFQSTNGTYINGEEIIGKIALNENDTILAGMCVFGVILKGTPNETPRKGLPQKAHESSADLDISDTHILKGTKDKLLHSHRALKIIYTVMTACNSESDYRLLLERLLRSLLAAITASRGEVIVKEYGSELGITHTCCYNLQGKDESAIPKKVLEDIVRSGNPVLGKNVAAGQGEISFLCAPLRSYGRVFGAIYLERFQEYQPFSNEDMDLLTALGIEMGSTLEKSFLLDELTCVNQSLEKALVDLKNAQQHVIQQERLKALGQMASGIAHDFNNALTVIIGCLESARTGTGILDDEIREYLELASTAAQDAAKVVSNLREFYSHQEKDTTLLPCDLNCIADKVISLTQPKWKEQAQAKNIMIEIVRDFGKIPNIPGDETALRQALINLIFNAVDALPHGGTITIRTYPEKEHVALEVRDNGIGMGESDNRHCMEPFFTTKGCYGSGLGLFMVYGIVQKHTGTITVQSELGKGTVFKILMPGWRPQHPPAVEPGSSGPLPSMSVLLVEDDVGVATVIKNYLQRDHHKVEVAKDGCSGLQKFLGGKFDMVITDKAMPNMNGEQLSLAIKQVTPHVPVIMLTGFGEMMEATGEKPPGVDLILNKPVTCDGLRTALGKVVAPHG